MKSVVFAAPYGLESTMRFLLAASKLADVQFGVVSHESLGSMASKIESGGGRLSGFAQVQNALDPDELEAGVRRVGTQLGGKVDVLMGILEPMQEPMAVVRERLGISGLDIESARRFRDKSHMKDVLRSSGLPCAAHSLAESPAVALEFADGHLPLIAKPPAGAGAIDTFRVETTEQLESYLRSVPPSKERPLLLEEFIQGDEYSFDSVSIGGDHVFHSISAYAPTPLTVMQTPWIQWTVLLPRNIDGPEFSEIHEVGPQALSALGMTTGMTHMEWFRRHDGSTAISEVAARPPGAQFTTLMSYAHDHDFYKAWAEVTVFERFDPPERRYATGGAYLRGQGSGSVTGIEGLEKLERELSDLVVEAKLPRPGQPKASGYEGEGYIIVRHPESQVVSDALDRIVSTIRVHLDGGGGS